MNKPGTDGRFTATAWIQGRKRFFRSRLSQADADRQRDDARAAASRPTLPQFARGTFARFVYDVYCPHTYPDARGTTRHAYDGILRHHLLPALGHLQMADIGFEEFKALKDGIVRRTRRGEPMKRPLSQKRLREIMLRAREIMGLYVKLEEGRGARPRTDWRVVKLPKLSRRKKVREEPEEDFTIKLMNAARGTWMAGPLFAALFLGLRRGEVCGLKWRAIDRRRLQIDISEQRHPLLEEGARTKGEARFVPVPRELLDHLDRIGDKSSVYVFTMPSKRRKATVPIIPTEISRWTPRLCRQAKLKARTFHDLRAFAASNLKACGVDPFVIMEILGHTRLDTTMLYLYGREEKKRDAIKGIVSGFLEGEHIDGGLFAEELGS